MAALAYTLGKREINYYFSVRSAKALALGAVLLLTACHAASRRYRGEGAAAGSGGHAGRGTGRRGRVPTRSGGAPGGPPGLAAGWSRPSGLGTGPVGVMGLCSEMLGPCLCVCRCRGQSSFFHAASPYMQINSLYLTATVVKMLIGVWLVIPLLGGGISLLGFPCHKGLWRSGEWGEVGREALGCCASGFRRWWCHSRELGERCK